MYQPTAWISPGHWDRFCVHSRRLLVCLSFYLYISLFFFSILSIFICLHLRRLLVCVSFHLLFGCYWQAISPSCRWQSFFFLFCPLFICTGFCGCFFTGVFHLAKETSCGAYTGTASSSWVGVTCQIVCHRVNLTLEQRHLEGRLILRATSSIEGRCVPVSCGRWLRFKSVSVRTLYLLTTTFSIRFFPTFAPSHPTNIYCITTNRQNIFEKKHQKLSGTIRCIVQAARCSVRQPTHPRWYSSIAGSPCIRHSWCRQIFNFSHIYLVIAVELL